MAMGLRGDGWMTFLAGDATRFANPSLPSNECMMCLSTSTSFAASLSFLPRIQSLYHVESLHTSSVIPGALFSPLYRHRDDGK